MASTGRQPHGVACVFSERRRSLIGDTRFPNVYSISDAYFHGEMMAKNPRIRTWDMPMYYYNYLRPGSISAQIGRTTHGTRAYWENA